MRAAKLLKVASIVAWIQFAAHTLLFLRAVPRHGPIEIAVLDAMKNHRFDFAGSTRSYWDFYYGYGLFAAFNVFIEAVLFGQLAAIAKTEPARVRPIVASFVIANFVYAILCLRYFFITPVIPDLILAVILGLAFFTARPKNFRRAPA